MKKYLLIMAVAALALTSCSSDETIAVNQSDSINFRSLTNNLTRAADIESASDLKSFNVYAQKSDDKSDYIGTSSTGSSESFVSNGSGTYTSASKHYWPASGNLDFYAWSANSTANGNKETSVTATAYNIYDVTVPSTAADQPDFIYASNFGQAKVTSVALTFNHYESRIVLKVKNTASNLNFEVTGWKIVYPDNAGTITFSGFSTGTTRTATWSANTTQSVDNEFVSMVTSTNIAANTTTAAQLGTGPQQMIMIPQETVGSTPPALAYLGTGGTYKLNRAYIAIEYSATGSNTITSGWRCWPLPANTTWEQGKQYTYIIDIADGGYKELDPNDGSTDPEPELANSLIQFASITVTDWITDLDGNTTDDDDIEAGM